MTKEEKKNLLKKGELPLSIRQNNVFKTVSSLLSYIGCILVTILVTRYIDGTAGVILTAALICAFVISMLMTVLVSRSMQVEISGDKPAASKGDTVMLTVSLYKTMFLPSPVLEIYADNSPQLSPKDGTFFKAALAGREKNVVKIPFSADFSGEAQLSVKEIRLTDYLGIFSFRMNHIPFDPVKLEIYPDIPDAAVQTDFLKTTSMFVNNDDDEEESDETSLTPTGVAGYEHRLYVPGDPIKRINWKLSSKRDEYMVRLDERIAGKGQMFFLDAPEIPENVDAVQTRRLLAVRDTVIEGALAMLTMLIRENREATFFFPDDGLWLGCEVRAISDVYHIQELLGGFKPDRSLPLVPTEITDAGKVPICFTAAADVNSGSAAAIAQTSADVLVIAALSAQLQTVAENMWTISDEFEFKKQK